MNILAIDTATEACSAALYIGGSTGDNSANNPENNHNSSNITSQYELAPRQHSRLILKMIDELLTDAELQITDIDAIAFGRGPGSFMGLRIAAGVVQGIAFAHDIPVIPISTLKAIAQRAYEESGSQYVLATIDARMDEVYWAAYYRQDQRWQLQGEESVISPEKVVLPEISLQSDQHWVGAGNGWNNYRERLLTAVKDPLKTLLPDCFPSAEVIVKLAAEEFLAGNTVPAAEAIPVYLRNDVAKKPRPVKL